MNTRRGFFSRLFSKKFEKGFFAVQVVVDAYGAENLRSRLHQLIDETPAESAMQKKHFYRLFTSAILENEPFFEMGYATYDDDADAAIAAYDEWSSEIEAAAATEEEETGDSVDGYRRLSSEKRFIVITMAFLLNEPHRAVEKYPWEDESLYARRQFGDLVDSISVLPFHAVEADLVFMMPGNEKDGFSRDDLASDGWEYLQPIHS